MNGQLAHRSRFTTPAILAIALTMGTVSQGLADAYDVAQQPMIGDAAPTFALESASGDSLALEDLRGTFLVIHFGASW